MLKSDLIAILVSRRGLTEQQAAVIIEATFECMTRALCAGDDIEIRGLGAFRVKDYRGYQGHNPRTGQTVQVKSKRGILFRTGKELRDRIDRGAGNNVVATGTNAKVGVPAGSSERVQTATAPAAPGSVAPGSEQNS